MNENDWIVVTGGGGAIGSVLARHFAEKRGSRVLALDRQFDAALDFPKSVVQRKVNLLDEAEVRDALAEHIPADEGPSVLVNAVGLIWSESTIAFQGGRLSTHSLESWRKVIDSNLTAAFVAASQAAARMIRRRRGSIINFSSIASHGNAGQAAYSAAKAGVEGLTRALAGELGPLGVRVNAVALGFIDVGTTHEALTAAKLKSYREKTPLGRLGGVQDVVSAIEYLIDNPFVNGSILAIDGGLRL